MNKIIEIIDALDKIGHKDVTISELVTILAEQSPMMIVLGYDEDKGGPVFLNGVRVEETDEFPVFILYYSEVPKKNQDLYIHASHDERVAEKKNRALDMAKKAQEQTRF